MQFSMNGHIIYHCKSYVLTIFVTVGAWTTQPQVPIFILLYCHKRGQLVGVKDSTSLKDVSNSVLKCYLLILNWMYVIFNHNVFI